MIWKFRLSDIEQFRSLCDELNVHIDIADDVSCLANPVYAGDLTIPNSLAVHPMEGADGDFRGSPGPLTLRRYKRFAAGGAGLIWAEAIAVAQEGRANPRQLWLHDDNRQAFSGLVSQMRRATSESMGPGHAPVIVAQLTHSGRYSKPEGTARPLICQRDPYRDSLMPQANPTRDKKSQVDDTCIITDEYLADLQLQYVNAATLAYEAGFDAVDIKSCHGYLVNELLASRDREGRYGGSFENRTRFILEVIDKIQAELGDRIGICLRLGFYDAIPFPYGWGVDKNDYTKPDLTEPKKLVKLLYEKGVRLINFTIANPYYNPHVGRPFNQPIQGAYPEPEHPLAGVERLINIAAEVQKDFPDMAFVGTGYSWLRQLMGNVAAASIQRGKIKMVGAGRMAFAYPDFARDMLTQGGLDKGKVCVGCSACTQLMRDGQMAGCVIRDSKIYKPIFQRGRRNDRDNLRGLARACLQCQEPTCQLACPAGIDIPQFVQKFLDGDEQGAYEVIRQQNILPEVCGWLCPVEQQCQGHCLQGFLGEQALPIADIQRYLARRAIQEGWSRIRLPEKTSGRNIAVLGAGPAGLAATAVILEAGHTVTLFDKNSDWGGMIESVVPVDRQSDALKREVMAIFNTVPPDRLQLRLGTVLSEAYNLTHILQESFDAVFVGVGLPSSIRSSSESLEGLYDALRFLSQAKKGEISLEGKQVAVIGGGNTAMDAAVTAVQLKASDVYVIYRRSFAEMPAWSGERNRAVELGVHFLILTQQLGYESSEGMLKAIQVCPTRLGEPDDSGRRRPVALEDRVYTLDVDVVVEAIGQTSGEELTAILPGVDLDKGLIQTRDGSFQTSRDGIFAGGDIVRGASTVVAAVADGMNAAREIIEYLK